MMTIMTDLHFTESISYVDWGTGVRPTPAASPNAEPMADDRCGHQPVITAAG